MPPPDPDYFVRGIVEGVLLKLGDILLVTSPATLKKGGLVALIIIRKMNKKKTGGKKHVETRRSPKVD